MRVNVIPRSCVTATQHFTSASPHSKNDCSLANLQGHWLEMGDTAALHKSSNELWGFLTIEKCLSISLKSESHPLPTPEHPQRKHPLLWGNERRAWGRTVAHLCLGCSQKGVPELRTYCSDPWALLNDLHPSAYGCWALRVYIQTRSLYCLT